jgi:predicted nucleic acid-binding protein
MLNMHSEQWYNCMLNSYHFFKIIHIPEMVWKELVIDGKDRKETELIEKSDFLQIHGIKDLNLYKLLRKDLDEEEGVSLKREKIMSISNI